MEKSMAQKLKELLEVTSKDDFEREWAEIEKLGYVGPTMEELYMANARTAVVSEVNSNVHFDAGQTSSYLETTAESVLALAA